MITLCHALNDAEVFYLRSALQNAGVLHFIVGEHFGSLYSLYLGIQVASYNERRFLVLEDDYAESIAIVEQIRKIRKEVSAPQLTFKSKLRIVLETCLLGWSSLGGERKTS